MQIPRLHPDTIAQVKERTDIVEVISEYVVLRKRGKDYLGLCPFHNEKTPSFSVSPSKQMYYCFGCSAGGNAINFLMEVGKQSFTEVVLALAQRYQVPVQSLEPEQRQELQRQLSLREQLYEILALAAAFYQHALRQPQGQQALDYLIEKRRLTEETIQHFQLGYAPIGWETTYRYLVEQKGKPVQLLEQAGLIAPRKTGDGYRDRFHDRLIIPIHDSQGRVIGFGGRTLKDEQPKYLNSPETPLFDKSKTLFALDKARQAISKQDQAIVVEGYFDAIALHAAGITNVVASLGTALSLDQVRQLLRYTESKQIILNFDTDQAGAKAAERAIKEIVDLVYKSDLTDQTQDQVRLRILTLPDGKDADEFLQTYPNATDKCRELLTNAPLWFDWQIEQLLIGRNLKKADQFQQVTQEMVKLLSQIDNAVTRTYYINHCAQILSQGENKLVTLFVQNLQTQIKKLRITPIIKSPDLINKQKQPNSPHKLPLGSEHNLLEQAEALLLRIYLHRPEYRQTIIDTLESQDLLFTLSHHRFLWQQILELQTLADKLESDSPNPLLSLLSDLSSQFPEQMAQVEHLFHLDELRSEDIIRTPVVIRAAAAALEMVEQEKHRRYCLQKWQTLDLSTDAQRQQYYWQEYCVASRRIKELEQIRKIQFSDITELFIS